MGRQKGVTTIPQWPDEEGDHQQKVGVVPIRLNKKCGLNTKQIRQCGFKQRTELGCGPTYIRDLSGSSLFVTLSQSVTWHKRISFVIRKSSANGGFSREPDLITRTRVTTNASCWYESEDELPPDIFHAWFIFKMRNTWLRPQRKRPYVEAVKPNTAGSRGVWHRGAVVHRPGDLQCLEVG